MIDIKKLWDEPNDFSLTVSILADMEGKSIIYDVVEDGKIFVKTTEIGRAWFKVLKSIEENIEE